MGAAGQALPVHGEPLQRASWQHPVAQSWRWLMRAAMCMPARHVQRAEKRGRGSTPVRSPLCAWRELTSTCGQEAGVGVLCQQAEAGGWRAAQLAGQGARRACSVHAGQQLQCSGRQLGAHSNRECAARHASPSGHGRRCGRSGGGASRWVGWIQGSAACSSGSRPTWGARTEWACAHAPQLVGFRAGGRDVAHPLGKGARNGLVADPQGAAARGALADVCRDARRPVVGERLGARLDLGGGRPGGPGW